MKDCVSDMKKSAKNSQRGDFRFLGLTLGVLLLMSSCSSVPEVESVILPYHNHDLKIFSTNTNSYAIVRILSLDWQTRREDIRYTWSVFSLDGDLINDKNNISRHQVRANSKTAACIIVSVCDSG